MRASTNDPLSGRFVVAIHFPKDPDRAEPDHVRNLLEGFLLAVDFGFVDASLKQPASRDPDSTVWEEAPGGLRLQFVGTNLPRAAFRILRGMLVGHSVHLGDEITEAVAQHDGTPGDLLDDKAPGLPPIGDVPFALEIPDGGNLHKSLRVCVDFRAPVPEEDRDSLIQMFTVWDALVLGPFPAQGRAIGDSWAGPAQTSYLLPTELEHFVEDYESGHEAFTVLIRALLRLHARLPIEALEIE